MIFTGKINLKIAVLLWVFLNTGLVKADHCPSPETIKERKISRDYEWTIDERRTLDDVLAVEKLYSVRIKNQGEFIACYYSGGNRLLRLDGKPEKDNCLVNNSDGNWNRIGDSETVCEENDIALCEYQIKCD